VKEDDGMADQSASMHFGDIMTKTGDAALTLLALTIPLEETM
jgi:hypothetical protein